jgi:hypothetical protein
VLQRKESSTNTKKAIKLKIKKILTWVSMPRSHKEDKKEKKPAKLLK